MPPSPPSSPSLSPALQRLHVSLLLAAFFLLSGGASLFQGQTYDEAVHLTAGYLHLTEGEFRYNAEHPPLVKLIAALPLLVRHPALNPVAHFSLQAEFETAEHFLQGHEAIILLHLARLFVLLFNGLAGLVLYRYTRELFGHGGGLIALALFAFSPLFLAYSPIIDDDVALITFLLLTLHGLLRINRGHDHSGFWMLALGVGGGLGSKFSYLFFAPLFALATAAICVQPLWQKLYRVCLQRIGVILLALLAGYLLLWTLYLVPQLWGHHPEDILGRILPRPFLHGLRFVIDLSGHRPIYILGATHEDPVWYYFWFAFLVKSTLPLLALFAVALVLSYAITRQTPDALVFALLPVVYAFGAYCFINLQIGVRHFLPACALGFVLIGGLASLPWRQKYLRQMLFVVLLLHALTALLSFPNYLPYFNSISRVFGGPIHCLADSNLDWGQGLPALKRWQEQHQNQPVILSYFGTDDPNRYDLSFYAIQGYGSNFKGMRTVFPQTPLNGVFAIGATNLQGCYLEQDFGFNIFAPLQALAPSAQLAGGAMLIYQLHQPGQTLLQQAIAYYRVLARSAPPQDRLRFALACALMEDHEYAEALPLLRAYAPAHAEDGNVLDHLGVAELAQGQPREALAHLQKAAREQPGDAKTIYNLAGAYCTLGDFQRARANFLRAEQLMPGFLDAAAMAKFCTEKLAPSTTHATTASTTSTTSTASTDD